MVESIDVLAATETFIDIVSNDLIPIQHGGIQII